MEDLCSKFRCLAYCHAYLCALLVSEREGGAVREGEKRWKEGERGAREGNRESKGGGGGVGSERDVKELKRGGKDRELEHFI